MSIIKSHFYIVKGTKKGEDFPCIGWEYHSFLPIEKFVMVVCHLHPRYSLEVEEIEHTDCSIISEWRIGEPA